MENNVLNEVSVYNICKMVATITMLSNLFLTFVLVSGYSFSQVQLVLYGLNLSIHVVALVGWHMLINRRFKKLREQNPPLNLN